MENLDRRVCLDSPKIEALDFLKKEAKNKSRLDSFCVTGACTWSFFFFLTYHKI